MLHDHRSLGTTQEYKWLYCTAWIVLGHKALLFTSTHIWRITFKIFLRWKNVTNNSYEKNESHFMAVTLVLLSLTVSEIITKNGVTTPPAEFVSHSNIYFEKCHFPSVVNTAHESILNQYHTCTRGSNCVVCHSIININCVICVIVQ